MVFFLDELTRIYFRYSRCEKCHLFLLGEGDGDSSFPKSIAEFPADNGQMTHAAGTGGLPPAGLDGPVVLADSGTRVTARGADFLLKMERNFAATTAQSVRLIAPFTK